MYGMVMGRQWELLHKSSREEQIRNLLFNSSLKCFCFGYKNYLNAFLVSFLRALANNGGVEKDMPNRNDLKTPIIIS